MEAYIDLISRPEGYMDLNAVPEPAGGGVALTDTTPYLYRISADGQNIGSQEFDEIVGGTVAWNQIIQNGNFADGTDGWIGINSTLSASNNVLTLTCTGTSSRGFHRNLDVTIPANHVVMLLSKFKRNNTGEERTIFYTRLNNGSLRTFASMLFNGTDVTELNGIKKIEEDANRVLFYPMQNGAVGDTQEVYYVNLIDLTQMFGSTIADYINSLETAHTGDGIAYFKSLFPKDYYAYDSGTLMSVQTSEHKMVGKNLIRTDDDNRFNSSIQLWGANDTTLRDRINTLPVGTYTCSFKYRIDTITGSATSGNYGFLFRFNNGSNVDKSVRTTISNIEASTEYSYSAGFEITSDIVGKCTSAYFYTGRSPVASSDYVTFYDFQLEYGNTATPYEPYISYSYPLDSSLTLRGIPKLDGNNKLYYDGDKYSSDGTVTRRYGIVDLSTLNWVYNATYNFFSATLTAKANGLDNAIIQGYKYNGWWSSWTEADDKVWTGNASNGGLVIKDTAYTSASDFKTAMSGVYMVYELATPTTETATPYTNPQHVAKGGTEEYVDSRDVPIPVGHNTKYQGVLL